MDLTTIGRWAFVIGVLISIIAGLGGVIPALVSILFILGLIVGFLNVGEGESTHFLVAVITLLLIGVAGVQLPLGRFTSQIVGIIQNLIAFVAAAGLVVAIKQALGIAKKLD
jgi:hypothetical protein